MSPETARRARPIADLPLEALLARSHEAARRWAVSMVLARPLDSLGAIPLETLATGAPALIEQITRALGSDAALEELLAAAAGGGGEAGGPGLAAFTGSTRPGALLEATEALRGVLWEILLEVLPRGPEPTAARLVGDLSDRLAQTCAQLLAANLERCSVEGEGREVLLPETPREHAAPVAPATEYAPRAARIEHGSPPPPGPPPTPARTVPSAVDRPDAGGGEAAAERGIVIVDERRAAYAPIERPPFRERVAATDTIGAAELRRQAGLDAAAPAGAEVARDAEISVRDERAEDLSDEGPAAWVGSIGRELRRHQREGEPFAVLLIEAPGEDGGSRESTALALEEALAAELREVGGSLTRERAGRWWALAPRTDRLGAQALSMRLEQVVEVVGRRSGAAGIVSIGVSVCPEDGTEAAALAAHADVGLYSTRQEPASGGWQPAEPA